MIEAGEPLLDFLKSTREDDKPKIDFFETMDTAQSRVHIVNITTGSWMFGDVENLWSHYLVIFVPKEKVKPAISLPVYFKNTNEFVIQTF